MWRTVRTISLSFDFEQFILSCSIKILAPENMKIAGYWIASPKKFIGF
jgi:hypothetical protein